MKRRRTRYRLTLAILAVLINGTFIALLGYAWIENQRQVAITEAQRPPALPVRLQNVTERPGESPDVDTKEIADKVAREEQRLANVPEEQKAGALNESADWLDRNSSPEAVQQIIERIAPAFQRPARAYAPAESPPPGRFDDRSGIPYASKKVTDAAGVERTEHTWVDKEGRTMVYLTRRETGADGKARVYYGAYQPDGSVFESSQPDTQTGGFTAALERISESPALQKIFTQVVQGALAARQEQMEQQKSQAESKSKP